jgi:hypothetical protein
MNLVNSGQSITVAMTASCAGGVAEIEVDVQYSHSRAGCFGSTGCIDYLNTDARMVLRYRKSAGTGTCPYSGLYNYVGYDSTRTVPAVKHYLVRDRAAGEVACTSCCDAFPSGAPAFDGLTTSGCVAALMALQSIPTYLNVA